MINECIRLYNREQEEKATWIYVAECLRTMTEHTAKYFGGNYIRTKLTDILDPKPQDERSAEEIIEHIKSKLRGADKEGTQK